MTQISREDVLKLASLSSLLLSDEEISALESELPTILEYVKQLDELDTDGVDPAYQVTGLQNVLRKDDVHSSGVSREDLLSLAPETLNSQVKVPKVL